MRAPDPVVYRNVDLSEAVHMRASDKDAPPRCVPGGARQWYADCDGDKDQIIIIIRRTCRTEKIGMKK